MDLRANTAVDVLIGPFVDKTDGNTTEDSLTLTQAEIKLSKNGQGLAQKNDDTSAAFDDDGYYNCELDATDTNTEGNLVLIVHQAANALPVRHEYNVLSEAAWDSLYVAKDTGFIDVNVKAISEDTAAADNLESACDNYSATRGLTGTALPAVAADEAGGVPISDAGDLDMDGTDTKIDNLLLGIVFSTTKAGTLSVTQCSTNLTEDTNGHYIGRIITWISGVLAGQSSDIVGYVGTNGVLTYTEVTDVPGSSDSFKIT